MGWLWPPCRDASRSIPVQHWVLDGVAHRGCLGRACFRGRELHRPARDKENPGDQASQPDPATTMEASVEFVLVRGRKPLDLEFCTLALAFICADRRCFVFPHREAACSDKARATLTVIIGGGVRTPPPVMRPLASVSNSQLTACLGLSRHVYGIGSDKPLERSKAQSIHQRPGRAPGRAWNVSFELGHAYPCRLKSP
jgi:hypothetical protein